MATGESDYHPTTVLVLRMFRDHGHSQYGREVVSQQEHALQAALFAEQANANSALITAALLHDVGHLLHALPDDAPEQGVDDQHEALAARWLERHFGPEVVEPVRLHVAAKRFLCATEPDYLGQLSRPSIVSLQLQGGPMSPDELYEFRLHPFHDSAVALRRWDDRAKVPDFVTPSLEHFVGHLQQALRTK